jgi:hypothetical protein
MTAKFDQFFEAFHACNETRAALDTGKLSTDKKLLRKKVIIPKRDILPPQPIASPYGELLSIQGPDGRWQNKEDVFFILRIPLKNYFGTMEEWEEATTFAVAKMRQEYDMFDVLGDAHDKAMSWLTSTKFIRSAMDIMNSLIYEDKPNTPMSPSKRKAMKAPVDPYRETLERTSRFSYSRTMSAMRTMSMEASAANSDDVEMMQRAAERARLALEMLTPTLNYAALTDRIISLKKTADKHEVRSMRLIVCVCACVLCWAISPKQIIVFISQLMNLRGR